MTNASSSCLYDQWFVNRILLKILHVYSKILGSSHLELECCTTNINNNNKNLNNKNNGMYSSSKHIFYIYFFTIVDE